MCRKSLRFPLLATVALCLGTAVVAEEVIYFTNGTTLPVRSHRVEDGMVHVDLGDNGFIAFPSSQVEKIVQAGRDVYLNPSFQNANVMTSGGEAGAVGRVSNDGPFPVSGRTSVLSSSRSKRRGDAVRRTDGNQWQAVGNIRPGEFGLQTEYPQADNPNQAARRIGAVGRRSIVSSTGEGMVGAQKLGRKHVITVPGTDQTERYTSATRIAVKPGVRANRRTSAGAQGSPEDGESAPPQGGNGGN